LNQVAIDVGSVLRDVGIHRTLESEGDEWIDRAMRELRTFAALPEWRTFKMEDFRAWAGNRIPAPHTHKVWGGFTARACKAHVIRWTGRYAASVSPKTHAHPVKLWEGA
jgi:hypothetical protein